MESQMQHSYDRDTHNPTLHTEGVEVDEDQQHHGEKKYVIKKVKAKAKKLKDTLIKHGHGHDHEGEDEGDDDNDDDEEMVEDPEVRGAPIYESSVIRSSDSPGSYVNSGLPRGNLERPSVMEKDRYDRSEIVDKAGGEDSGKNPPTFHHGLAHGQDVNREPSGVKIGQSTGLVADPQAPSPNNRSGLPSNYETKVTDPTGSGGEEIGVEPILQSFDKMGIHDVPNPDMKHEGQEQKLYSGTHDQFQPELVPKDFDPNNPEELPRDTLTSTEPSDQSSYTEKISSVIAEKATAAKDVIASKTPASATEYANKIAATVRRTLAPVYEKVAGAGGSTETPGTEAGQAGPGDKGVSVKEYLAEKLKPGDEDKELSEAITHVFNRGKGGGESEKEAGEEKPPIGNVTESEEVKQRRGSSDRNDAEGGNVTVEKGTVVDRLKGAVGSWFGKGNAVQKSQAELGTSYVMDEGLSTLGGPEKGGEGASNKRE